MNILSGYSIDGKSVTALRNARGLNRFVYISCAPNAAEKNWIDLARPCSKTLRGEPFVIVEAVGVDMFPHTGHKEMVMLFERQVKAESDAKAAMDPAVNAKHQGPGDSETPLVPDAKAAPVSSDIEST